MDLIELTIEKAHEGLVKKEFSALELTKAFLDKIKDLDKKISAFITVTPDSALSQAKKVDDLISQGRGIPILSGIPLAVKDIILIDGVKCTAASKILEDYIAPYDATVIKKLKSQGAVFLGKTNLDEFAMGASTENSAFFPTKNPHDLNRVPGGSSGGSAAAVAAGFSVYALGSDTGGSIRQPASFCGIVGLKPTYGAVSRYGLMAMASSLDQIGPMTRNVADARIVFEAIAGKDEKDSTSVEYQIPDTRYLPTGDLSKGDKIQSLRIGVPKEYFIKGMDPEVEKSVKNAIKKLEAAGAKIQDISLPRSTDDALAAYALERPERPLRFFKGKGCAACGQSGYKGRMAIAEVLEVTPEMRTIIQDGFDQERVQAELVRQNFLTLRQNGIIRALAGATTIEEVLLATREH